MAKRLIAKLSNFMMLSVLLPFVYGCNGGGDSASSVGSLLGSVPGSSVTGGSASTAATSMVTSDALATVHQPEPATMLLIGGGVIAMSYLRNRSRAK